MGCNICFCGSQGRPGLSFRMFARLASLSRSALAVTASHPFAIAVVAGAGIATAWVAYANKEKRLIATAVSPPFPGVSKQKVIAWFEGADNWKFIAADTGNKVDKKPDGSFSVCGDDKSKALVVTNMQKGVGPADLMYTVTVSSAGVSFDVLLSVSESPVVVTRKIYNFRGGFLGYLGFVLVPVVFMPVYKQEYANSIEALCGGSS